MVRDLLPVIAGWLKSASSVMDIPPDVAGYAMILPACVASVIISDVMEHNPRKYAPGTGQIIASINMASPIFTIITKNPACLIPGICITGFTIYWSNK